MIGCMEIFLSYNIPKENIQLHTIYQANNI